MQNCILNFVVACWLVGTVVPGSAVAQQWGNLRGRIIYGGDVPEPQVLDIERDAEVCGNNGLVDESLVVNKESKGLQYVAVWLESKDEVPVHPDLKGFPEKAPVLDNLNCRFEPHMLKIRTGQTVLFQNSDPVAHNAAVYVRRTTPFSEVIPKEKPLEKVFAKAETVPTRIDCSIHAWMKAWMVVTDHPYVAITDADGNFELLNVPAGEWRFRFWQERPGFLQSMLQDGQPSPLAKGAWTLTIPESGTLDLGELTAPADQFQKKKKR